MEISYGNTGNYNVGNHSNYMFDPRLTSSKWDEIRERMRHPRSKKDQEQPPKPKRGDAFVVIGAIVGIVAGLFIGGLFAGLFGFIFGGFIGGIVGATVGDWLRNRYLRRKNLP